MDNIKYICINFGRIIQTQIEVEGMKASNQERQIRFKEDSLFYLEKDFQKKAAEIDSYINELYQL